MRKNLPGATGHQRRRYGVVGIILFGVLAIELIGGLLSGSIALLADTVHVGFDLLGAGVGFVAITIAQKQSSIARALKIKTAGALINGALLVLLAVVLGISAIMRFFEPHAVNGPLALTFVAVGLLLNLICLRVLGHQEDDDLLKSSRAHVLFDTVSSLAALASSLLVTWTGSVFWDHGLTLIVATGFIAVGIGLIRTACHSLITRDNEHHSEEVSE